MRLASFLLAAYKFERGRQSSRTGELLGSKLLNFLDAMAAS